MSHLLFVASRRVFPIAIGGALLLDASTAAPLSGMLIIQSQAPGSSTYQLREYAADGTPLQTFIPPEAPGSTDSWHPRDLAISEQTVHLYNGTFDPYLSTLEAESGVWSHRTHDGWSTFNNVSYGGVARMGDRVFVSNMATSGRPSHGVVYFDLSANTSSEFAGSLEPTDLNAGLDGRLWVLSNRVAYAFDPDTLAFTGQISIADSDPRGIAVDANGNLYVASWSGLLIKYSPAGLTLGSLNIGGNLLDVDVSEDGLVAVGTRLNGAWLTTTALAPPTQIESDRWNSFVAFIPPDAAGLLGDMNCDGFITVSDIGGFVLALTDPSAYAGQYPNCDIALADINGDGAITVSDIGPFVALLTN
jgi:hypothetical protein